MAEQDPAAKLEKEVEQIKQKLAGIDLSRLNDMFEKIAKNVESWNEAIGKTAESMKDIVGYQAEAVRHNMNLEIGSKQRNQHASLEAEQEREFGDMVNQRLERGDSIFTQLKRYVELQKESLSLEHEHISAGYETFQQATKAATHLEGIMPALLAAVPFGGLIGFMLAGAVKEAEFKSDTAKIVQAWKVVGGGAKEFSSDVEHMLKNLSAEGIATAGELQGIARAFADMAIKKEAVLVTAGPNVDFLSAMGIDTHVIHNIYETSLAMDRLTQSAAGTFATLTGRGVRDFGNSITEVTGDLVKYGIAAMDADQNTMQFLNGVMQNAQQLKLYAVHLGDVANMTLRLVDMNKSFGPQFAGTVAQAGVGQMLGGIAGLDTGMAAYIGGEVIRSIRSENGGKLLGSDNKSFDIGENAGAIVEFRRGGRDLQDAAGFMSKTIQQLGTFASQPGVSGLDREYLLQTKGFGPEGSHAIMQLFDQIQAGKAPTDADLSRLNQALKDESDKTSQVVLLLNNLKTAIADIGNGLLGMILASLNVIVDGIKVMALELEHPFHRTDAQQSRLDEAFDKLSGTADRVGAYNEQTVEGFKRLGDAAGHMPGALEELSHLLSNQKSSGPSTNQYWGMAMPLIKDDIHTMNESMIQRSITTVLENAKRQHPELSLQDIKTMRHMEETGETSGGDLTRMFGPDEMIDIRTAISKSTEEGKRKLLNRIHAKYEGLDDMNITIILQNGDGTKVINQNAGHGD